MRKEQEKQYERVAAQVKRVRRLYSQIGEPLPVDIIIDLHQHLATALEAVAAPEKKRPKRRLDA